MGGKLRENGTGGLRGFDELGEEEAGASIDVDIEDAEMLAESCCESGIRIEAIRIYAKGLEEDSGSGSVDTYLVRRKIAHELTEIIEQEIPVVDLDEEIE